MSGSSVPRVAAPLIVALVAAADVLGAVFREDLAEAWPWGLLILFETMTAAVVGLLIVRRQPRNAVGWLLLAHALLVSVDLGIEGFAQALPPATEAWLFQAMQGTWVTLYLGLALIGYLFPDGRFLSRRWRRFVFGCLGAYALFILALAFDTQGFKDAYPDREPPLPGLPMPILIVCIVIGLAGTALSLIGAVVCARARLRRAEGEERMQLLWFVWAALAIPAGLAVCWFDIWVTGGVGNLTLAGVTVAGSVLPLAIGAAILRRRLFDIELVLSRTLTYGALTAGVVAVYAGLSQGLGRLIGGSGPAGLVAVGVVAVAIQPVHAAVRRRVERWVYGDRSDPYGALRRLAGRLEGSLTPGEALDVVTGSVAEALRVREVTVQLHRGAPPAAADGALRVPLTHQGELLGSLAVQVPPGRQLSTADRRLLDDLARQAAAVVNAYHLTLDLQHSRARLVTTREEERRRLRRDLHDGLGPSLAAIVLKLNSTASLVTEPAAGRLLRELKEETKAAITEIRRLVDDLRPPALDEIGLVAAIRRQAQSLSRRAGPPAITVEGPPGTPPLPAAVEVAAYRIAAEAMTNVVRHSGATRALVTIAVDGALEVCVTDNGAGAKAGPREGLGWVSMRERAAELGGSCTITRRPEGGTMVRAMLPLAVAEPVPTEVGER